MLKFNPKSLRAVARLFRQYNDIDIFVEDKTGKGVYEALINRILDGSATVKKVIQVGDRYQVLNAWENDNNTDRKSLYIIDGDFDIHKNLKIVNDRLYQLNCYCIENILFCCDTACQIAYESDSESLKEDVLLKFDVESIISDVANYLVPLFIIYAVANDLDDSIKTIKNSIWKLSSSDKILSLDKDKVQSLIDDILSLLSSFDNDLVESKVDEIKTNLFSMGYPLDFYVSAKDYLLPLLHNRLRNAAGYPGSLRQLKMRLAQQCDLTREPGFTKAVIRAATS